MIACRRVERRLQALTHEYGTSPVGMALGDQRLFTGTDADWETRWEPSVPDATATLWRYMSLPKFCSLLEQKVLFFSLVDNMADRYEGFISPPISREHEDRLREAERVGQNLLHNYLRAALISCWTESDHESSLMWETHAGKRGVAVRTSFQHLQESIRSVAELPVTFGQVEYVDYHRMEVPRFGWAPLFHKRMEYRGEGEVRAVLPPPPFKDGYVNLHADIRLDADVAEQRGRYIPVNLDILVKEVVLPPHAPRRIAQVVKSVIHLSRVTARVTRSAIEQPPHESDRRDTGPCQTHAHEGTRRRELRRSMSVGAVFPHDGAALGVSGRLAGST